MHTRAITILQGVIVVRVISWSIYETLGHETPKGLVVLRCSVHLGIPFGEGVSTPITNGPCTGGRLRARIDDGQCKLTRGGTAVSLCNFHLTRVGKCKYEDNDFRNIGDAEKQYSGNLACPLIGALGYLPFCCSNVNCTDTSQPIRAYYICTYICLRKYVTSKSTSDALGDPCSTHLSANPQRSIPSAPKILYPRSGSNEPHYKTSLARFRSKGRFSRGSRRSSGARRNISRRDFLQLMHAVYKT